MLLGCNSSDTEFKNEEFSKVYSSLFQELKTSDVKLEKYIIFNNKVDTVLLNSDSINWNQELELFTKAEISKSAYSDYEIRTLNDGCEKYFQTRNDKHHVKKYHYSNCNGSLNVYIDVEKSSPLYKFNYHLELNKDGYLIETKTEIELAEQSNYRIEGKFIRTN